MGSRLRDYTALTSLLPETAKTETESRRSLHVHGSANRFMRCNLRVDFAHRNLCVTYAHRSRVAEIAPRSNRNCKQRRLLRLELGLVWPRTLDALRILYYAASHRLRHRHSTLKRWLRFALSPLLCGRLRGPSPAMRGSATRRSHLPPLRRQARRRHGRTLILIDSASSTRPSPERSKTSAAASLPRRAPSHGCAPVARRPAPRARRGVLRLCAGRARLGPDPASLDFRHFRPRTCNRTPVGPARATRAGRHPNPGLAEKTRIPHRSGAHFR